MACITTFINISLIITRITQSSITIYLHHTQQYTITPRIFSNKKCQGMNSLRMCKTHYQSTFLSNSSKLQNFTKTPTNLAPNKINYRRRKLATRACSGETEKKKTEKRTFLSLEEAGLVEISGLDTHERFLCRLTISSLNLLRVIAEQERCSIEDLNAGKVCDWFLKDKLKREQNLESAVLQWDDSDFQI